MEEYLGSIWCIEHAIKVGDNWLVGIGTGRFPRCAVFTSLGVFTGTYCNSIIHLNKECKGIKL